MATISGTVKDSTGAFAARLVRAYRRSDGAFAGQVLSNATTGAYSITTLDGTAHFAVAHDGVVGDYDAYWNNVVLAMHMDGENNSTTFQDLTGKTVTPFGNAKIVTTQSMFGGASAYFDGTGGYLTVPDSEGWNFGSADFTIEMFVNMASVTTTYGLVAHWSGTTNHSWGLCHYLNKIQFFYSATGANLLFFEAPSGCLANTWHHIAACRSSGVVKLFVDGGQVASAAVASALFNSTAVLEIGGSAGGVSTINGHIDDLRITKGVARYTAGFTPPTAPFLGAISIDPSSKNALIFDNLTPL